MINKEAFINKVQLIKRRTIDILLLERLQTQQSPSLIVLLILVFNIIDNRGDYRRPASKEGLRHNSFPRLLTAYSGSLYQYKGAAEGLSK